MSTGTETGAGRTLRDVIEVHRHADPQRVALLVGDETITYRQLCGRIAGVAHVLAGHGIVRGDRVAVLLPNCPEYLEAFFGIVAIGAVAVPLNTRLHPAEQVRLLQDCRPRLLLAHDDYAVSIAAITAATPALEAVVRVGGTPIAGEHGYQRWRGEADALPAVALTGEETAAILYTSGTTSAPKGVMLTHRNYLADFAHVAAAIGLTPDSVNLQLSPLYHAAAVHTLVHLMAGGTTVLAPRFDPAWVLEQIESRRVSYFFAVPTMLYQLLDHPEVARYDLASLQTISYGAAAITGARLQQALAVFGSKLLHAYGMTETTSHASVLSPQDHLVAAGSIGRGLPGTTLRVIDEAGADAAPDTVGEIVVCGDNVMRGYWERIEETAATLRNGWLYTGDLARVDSRGYVYIVDRTKDMVISGGVNIYPREVEEVLARHPAVAEAAVYGVPDAHWGEALAAAIVLKPGMNACEKELLDFARERLAGFKLPKQLALIDSLPKTASGKVQKTELRKQHTSTR